MIRLGVKKNDVRANTIPKTQQHKTIDVPVKVDHHY